MPYSDPIEAKAYKAAYHQKNKDKHREANRKNSKKDTRKRNRNEYAKAWRALNPDKSREYAKRYKEGHTKRLADYNDREEVKARKLVDARKRYANNKAFMDQYKAEAGCKYCPENDPVALDCHHRDRSEKEATVHNVMHWSRARILRELEKCDVVCSNCHRKLHREDVKGWWKERLSKEESEAATKAAHERSQKPSQGTFAFDG